MSLTVDGLVAIINEHRCETVVEIGVHRGRVGSAVRLRCPTVKTFWMVDPWLEYHTESPGAMERHDQQYWDDCYALVSTMFADDDRFIILRMTSDDAASIVPDGLHMVYLDGDHSYKALKKDIQTWLPKIADGGLLVGDDYSAYRSVRKAVNELLCPVTVSVRRRVWTYRKGGMCG